MKKPFFNSNGSHARVSTGTSNVENCEREKLHEFQYSLTARHEKQAAIPFTWVLINSFAWASNKQPLINY